MDSNDLMRATLPSAISWTREDQDSGHDSDFGDLYARFFRALGDPTRVRILHLLLQSPSGEAPVGQLVAALGAPQGRVSTHLGCLRWCGLVQTRREGKLVYYRVADSRVRALLALAGELLRDQAASVASCGIIR